MNDYSQDKFDKKAEDGARELTEEEIADLIASGDHDIDEDEPFDMYDDGDI